MFYRMDTLVQSLQVRVTVVTSRIRSAELG